MQHIFLLPDQITAGRARIVGSDHLHLARVLRARPGDKVILLDNRGNGYRSRLVSVGKDLTEAEIETQVDLPPEPPIYITVAQALGKGDKFEQVIQHGTECGASAFLPVHAERCVVEVSAAKLPDRLARWQQIAKGAAEQSGRARIAEIRVPVTFAELLRDAEANDTPLLVLHTEDSVPMHHFLSQHSGLTRLILAVGPEGGWSRTEVTAAREAKASLVSLGLRTLRTETAALVALSQILYTLT